MFQRIGRLALVMVMLSLLSGCVEMTQTITLNPNGSGKAEYDVLMPADMGFSFGPQEKARKTSAEILQEAVEKTLTKTKGVTAWKDVSVKWAQDGRLHFVGT